MRPVGSPVVLEVCRDFRLPQFKTTELSPAGEELREAGTNGGGPLRPSNGSGPLPVNVLIPAAAGRKADAEPEEHPHARGLFSHYVKKRRFSFFG
jgi:hypothetical protein